MCHSYPLTLLLDLPKDVSKHHQTILNPEDILRTSGMNPTSLLSSSFYVEPRTFMARGIDHISSSIGVVSFFSLYSFGGPAGCFYLHRGHLTCDCTVRFTRMATVAIAHATAGW